MFCPKCGSQIADDAAFCVNCGHAVNSQHAQAPQTQQPVQSYPPVDPQAQQLPMKWFKFLIYFALWASAVLNALTAFSLLTGSVYGTDGEAKLVYALFEDMKTLDTICGVLLLALVAWTIYTRFQLAGFKAKAPAYLTIMYGGVIAFNLIYIIGCISALPEYIVEAIDHTAYISSIVSSAAIMFVNISYFKKRAHLFNK